MSALEQIAAARGLLAALEARASEAAFEPQISEAVAAACSPLRAALEQLRATKPQTKNLTRSASSSSSSEWELAAQGVSALLIDLDGTMYTPHGLIHGADDFYAFLVRRQIPHVFVSNTGAKGASGVREKLRKIGGLYLSGTPPPLERILTAAEAQARFLVDTIPRGSRVFAIAGGSDPAFWRELLETEGGSELSSRGCPYSPRRGHGRNGLYMRPRTPNRHPPSLWWSSRRIDTRRCRPSDWRAWPCRLVV